jgi:hypothetical protein
VSRMRDARIARICDEGRGMRRRVARHAFTALSALSLVLCVAVCVLWVRSGWRWESVVFTGRSSTLWANSSDGVLWLEWTLGAGRPGQPWTASPGWAYRREQRTPGTRPFLVFTTLEEAGYWWAWNRPWVDNLGSVRVSPWIFRESYLFYAAVFAAMPTLWLVVRRRRVRRHARGLCTVCRYDLRAHSAGDRCPECGTGTKGAA